MEAENEDEPMKLVWWLPMLLIGPMYVGAFFMLHSAACGMYSDSVERLWRHDPSSRATHQASYGYCKFVSRATDWIGPSP